MSFSNPIVGGTTLIREAIRSADYVPGVSGWTINKDGTAEFNNVVIRGQLDVTSPSGAFIRTFVDSNVAQFLLQPPDDPPTVFGAATIYCQNTTDGPLLVLEGPSIESPTFVAPGTIRLGADQVLEQTGVQLDAQQMVIGATDGGPTYASTTEVLSEETTIDGNLTVIGGMAWGNPVSLTQQVRDTSVTNGTTTSTSFTGSLTTSGRRGVTFVAPPSGNVVVYFSLGGNNNGAGNYNLCDFEVREGGTIGSGTVVRAADENTATQFQSDSVSQGGPHASFGLVIGLTPGDTYNAEIMYRVTAGTGTFNRRKIFVTPVM